VVLRTVQNAEDDDVPVNNPKKNLVGKTVRENTSKATIAGRESFRVGFQTKQRFSVGGKKFITESGTAFFIPVI